MKLRIGAVVLAGAVLGAAALVPVVSEGRNNNAGSGRGRGGPTQYQCRQASANCPQDRHQMRDGSCGNANCSQQGTQRDCPGPADCGQGAGAQGGTGSGAPPTTK
jgi:hypothetical protein